MKFKHDEDRDLFLSLHPILIMIYADLFNYAKTIHNIEITITDTISTEDEDEYLGRSSNAHQFGIALDFRTRDIDAFVLEDIVSYIEEKPEYDQYKYTSYSGNRRLIYVHNSGNGEHAHMQIDREFILE